MYKCVTNSGEFHKTKNPYIYVCVCVYYIRPQCTAWGISVPQPGIEPRATVVNAWNPLGYQATPLKLILKY